MITREEYLDAWELRRQGWSISAISRHLGRDRKTVRSYLGGGRVAGVRSPAQDMFRRFLPYCRQRLADDPHVPAMTLFEEVVELGYPGGYSTFTRALRRHRVRPPCGLCCPGECSDGTRGPRRAGEEIRFSMLELPGPPAEWGCGSRVHLLTGSLAGSGRWRGVLIESRDFPQLVEAIDQVMRRLGGIPPRWRLDRTTIEGSPTAGRVPPAFAQVARYYGAGVDLSPAKEAEEAGEVLDAAVRAWWHAGSHGTCFQAAQDGLDQLAARMEGHGRAVDDTPAATGAPTGRTATMLDLPAAPFPASVRASRIVSPQGLVSFRGSFYAVQPDLAGALVEVRRRLDEPYVSIATLSGAVIARHPLAPPGAGLTVLDGGTAIVLERPPRLPHAEPPACRSGKGCHPLSHRALAEADALRESAPERGPALPEGDGVHGAGAAPGPVPGG